MENDTPNDGNAFYADSGDQQRNMQPRFDFTREDLPKPWLFGIESRKFIENKYAVEVTAIEQLAARPLNPTEREGLAYWLMKEMQIRSRGFPLGIIGGAYRAYTTHQDFRWPFWKPSTSFNPNIVTVLGKTLLEGQLARVFWHTTRYGAYGLIVGPFISGLFTTSWAVSAANTGRLRDPRTKGLFESIMAKAQQQRQQMAASRNKGQPLPSPALAHSDTNSPTSNEYGEVFPQDSDSYKPQSSQASLEATSYERFASISGTGSYMPSPANEPSSSQEPARPNSKDDAPATENDSSQFFDNNYDDASPTADYSASPSPGGNSWDRIRAGRNVASTPSARKYKANNTKSTDASRSPEVDSRSQAQKDFDASVERERQGRNFD